LQLFWGWYFQWSCSLVCCNNRPRAIDISFSMWFKSIRVGNWVNEKWR
jgi:hypothetical protein